MADFTQEKTYGTEKKLDLNPDAKTQSIENSIAQEQAGPSYEAYFSGLQPEQAELFRRHIADVTMKEGQAAGERLGNRYAAGLEYARLMDTTLEDAMNSMDSYNATMWKNPVDDKGALKAIADYLKLGRNTLASSNLGNKLYDAELRGSTKEVEAILNEYRTVQAENETLQDGVPRNIFVEALKNAAQTVPYTAAVAIPEIIGGAVGGKFGAYALGGAAGYGITFGNDYIEFRNAGFDKELAGKLASVSAVAETVLEQVVGNIAEARVTATGKKILSKKIVNRVLGKIGGKSAFMGLVKKGAGKVGETFISAGIEGLEESSQSFANRLVYEAGAALQEEGVEIPSWGDWAKGAAEEMKGAFMGSLILGPSQQLLAAGVSKALKTEDYQDVMDKASTIESKTMFEEAVKDSKIFEGLSEEEQKKAINSIWESAEARREADIAESMDVSENAEGNPVDETGERVGKASEFRTEEGELATETATGPDGKNYFLVGDTSRTHSLEADGNRYGYIEYSEDNDTVTINQFKMTSGRENIAKEFFQNFAENFAGKKIVWNPKQETNLNLRNEIINENPRGKKAGLDYFENAEVVSTRKADLKIARQIKAAIPSMTTEQVGASLSLVKAVAKAQGMTTDQLLKNFNNEQIVTNEKTEGVIQGEQQLEGQFILGAHELNKAGKAIIYVAKNGDMNTFVHEFAHHTETFLTPEQRNTVMQELGFDSWNRETSEKFADGLIKYMRTGKAQSKGLQAIFEKVAQIIGNAIRGFQDTVQLSKKLMETYEELLKDDGSGLSQAMKIAEEADAKLSKSQKKDTETKADTITSEEENQDVASQATDEARDEKGLEGTKEDIVENAETVKEAAEALNEKAEEVIQDANTSTEEKSQAAADASGAAYVDNLDDYALFQTIGIEAALNNAEPNTKAALKKIIDSALAEKEKLEKWGKSEEEIEARLRDKYGIVKSNGVWKFDIDTANWKIKKPTQLKEIMSNIVFPEQKVTMKLDEILDAPALYNLIPKIKDAKIEFRRGPTELSAILNPENTIIINLQRIAGLTGPDSIIAVVSQKVEQMLQKENGEKTAAFDEYMVEGFRGTKSVENLKKQLLENPAYKAELEAKNKFGEGSLFQIIGEKGALELDRVNEVHTLEDNRNVAKEMEEAGKDAKTIRLATGWEKGIDGKWRYETEDLVNKFDLLNKALDFEKRNPKFKEYSEKLWKSYDGGPELTEAEIQEFDALSDEANTYYVKKDVKLKDILDAPELYAAYPQLKEIDVKFVNDPLNTTKASYVTGKDLWTDAEVNLIQINNIPNSNEKEYESILLHELQHVIQSIEGFATGGNPEQFDVNTVSRIKVEAEIDRKRKERNELIFSIPSEEFIQLDKKLTETSMTDEEYRNARNDIYKKYEVGSRIISLGEEIESLKDRISEIDENALDGQIELEDGRMYEDSFNAYQSLSGEVEARNVQKRLGMSAEERLNTLLSDSEDIERSQQIVLYQTLAAEAAVEAVAQERAVREEYENTENWMKAPNGEDTNLSEKQWIQVRTDNFKKWFGDWENDPQNASKVVDENGEPLVVYHGTTENFTVFDASKSRANMDIQGNFFSPWDIDAQGYGPNVRAFYLNIKNPADESKGYKALHAFTGQNEAGTKARELLKAQGYDGVNNGNEEYIAFDPNQIKSATDNNGNFDESNPDILFQTVDLTNEFTNIKSGAVTAQDVENYINSIIGQVYDTATKPLKIQLVNGNKAHVVNSNKKLKAGQLKRHESALMGIQKIIENSVQKGKSEPVDVSHNTGKKTLKHKANVLKYVHFESVIKINNDYFNVELVTERVKGQTPDLLDLYNVHVKKLGPTATNLIALQRTLNNNNTTVPNVNDVILLQTVSSEAAAQERAVREEYENTEKWMKAPNGEDTNLTEKQWVQVRTDNFKKWFGDWENDPQNASKVVDENGEPLVVYHGTIRKGKRKFSIFDTSSAPSWFTPSKNYAEVYFSEKKFSQKTDLYPVFLNVKNLKDVGGIDWGGSDTLKSLSESTGIPLEELEAQEFENTSWRWQVTNDEKFKKLLIARGFDGIKAYEAGVDSYAVFSPSQIKSATDNNGNFDESNPDILFQTAYHGTSANFDKFDTSYMNTGEGSQSFGWGVYVTASENIARDYAERQYLMKYGTEDREARKAAKESALAKELEERKDYETPEAYAAYVEKYKARYAEMEKDGVLTPFQKRMFESSINNMNEEARVKKLEDLDYWINKDKSEIEELQKEIDFANANKDKAKRNLYTVEIPDNKYLVWDKTTPKAQRTRIMSKLYDYLIERDYKGAERELREEIIPVFSSTQDGREIYNNIMSYLGSDKEASEFLFSIGIVGMEYPAGTNFGTDEEARNYVLFDDSLVTITDHTLFQTAYHGTAANFEKFNLNYGLSGEGSMSFGYGVYLTNDKAIAEDYAKRQVERKSLKNFAEAMLEHIESGLRTFEEEKQFAIERYSKYIKTGDSRSIAHDMPRLEFAKSLTSLDDLKKAVDLTGKRHLYTTTIPDGKYLYWDKDIGMEEAKKIAKGFRKYCNEHDIEIRTEIFEEDPSEWTYNSDEITGETLYSVLKVAINNPNSIKVVSEYLNSIGYVGVDYPAGSIHGNGNGARNYVIFDENDVIITDNTLFQTEKEMFEHAATFDSWEDYKADVEGYRSIFGNDENVNHVPVMASDNWYKDTWEQAKAIARRNTYDDDYVKDVRGEESEETETLKDQQWYDEISQNEDMLLEFVRSLSYNAFTEHRGAPADYEEQQQWENEKRLRDRFYKEIGGALSKAALVARRFGPGEKIELDDKTIKAIKTMLRNNKRDFRDLYADFTGDSEWAIPEGMTTNDKIAVRIGVPVEETYAFTPKEKQAIIDRLDFEDLKKEIKDGTLEMDDDRLFKLMNGYEDDIRKLEKKIEALRKQEEEDAILNVKQTAEIERLYQEKLEKQARQEQLKNIRDIKVRLIKDINRKVDFRTVNYDEGRKIIAIQALWEDRLAKYVNDFINQEGAYIRDAYSLYRTDYNYRARLQALAARDADLGGKGSRNMTKILKLFDTKTFDKWTAEERQFVAEHLPLTDWIKELGLEQLSKERKGALQMELQSEEVQNLLKEALPEEMLSLLSQKEIKNWTLEQMEDLVAVVNNIRKEGREKLQVKNEARLQAAEAIRNRIEAALKDSGIAINADDDDKTKEKKQKKIDAFNKKVLGIGNPIKGTLEASKSRQNFLNRLLHGYSDANVRRVARILDNGKEGANTTLLYYRENECYNQEQKMMRQRSQRIERAVKENDIKLSELFEKVTVNFADGSAEFTVDELLYFAAASLDDNSREAVACGNMYDDTVKSQYRGSEELQEKYQHMAYARLDKVLEAAEALPEKFKKLSEAIQKDYGEQYERMNKISIDEFNSPVWRVQHYVPLVRLESNGDTNANRVKQDLLGSMGGTGSNWVDKGMTKKRVEISPANQKPVETGLYSTWADSLKRTEHFIAYASYVRELNRVYMNRDSGKIKQLMENRYGDGISSYINNYINEVANPDAGVAKTDFDRIIHALRGKTAPAYLSWKMSGIIKQACTSPWPFMAHVSPAEYAGAAFDLARNYKETCDAIKSKSEFMNARRFDPIADLLDEQKAKVRNKFAAGLNNFETLGMQGLEWIDWACVAPGWLAVYRKEYARLSSDKEQNALVEERRKQLKKYEDVEGLDWIEEQAQRARLSEDEIERRAVLKADDITRLCQPSNKLTDLAPMFKQRGPGSEVARTILQFTTSLNVIWQNIRYDLPEYARAREFEKVVGTIAGYTLAGIAMGLVTEGLGGDDDDDDENTELRKLLWFSTTQFTDAVPLVGSVMSNYSKWAITGEKPYNFGMSDLFPLLTKTGSGIQKATQDKWDKAVEDWAYAAGLGIGLPVSGIKELKAAAGIGDDDGELEFKPEAFIGRR